MFWWGELENTLRETGIPLKQFPIHEDADREKLMMGIEERRRVANYRHNCTEDCAKRGCGKLWVIDGNWKLRFSHCMYKIKNAIPSLPLINYPDICAATPERGKAFCKAHCESVGEQGIPTGLKEFLEYCSKKGEADVPIVYDIHVEDSEEMSDHAHLVDETVNQMQETDSGLSSVSAQGLEEFTGQNKELLSHLESEAVADPCNKDTGGKKTLRKWSRGHCFIVSGGGHIAIWQPLFKSESPSQVFLITLRFLYNTLKDIPPEQWEEVIISYDNMCNLDRLKAARGKLPLPSPYDDLWCKVTKIIDSLHIRNHKREDCKESYGKKLQELKKKNPDFNTMAAEQVFVWLGRFKKILCAMDKCHHLFYLHRMCVRRNRYTELCYKKGKKPVLPKVRGPNTT